jgi:hypothetical protein
VEESPLLLSGYQLFQMTTFLLVLLLLVQVPAAIQAQTGVVTGILRTDAGLPVEGVRVAVTPANEAIADSVLESQGLTDSTGRYRLENVSPGRYNILAGRRGQSRYHPGVTELGRATTIQVVAGSTIEVPDMVFGGRTVSGRVVDLATGLGRRIESLVLCCDDSLRSGGGALSLTVGQDGTFTKVSDDGSFVFPPVPPGNYSLSTVDSNVTPVSWALAVGENHVTGLQLEVAEGVEVQGTVLDQTGQPVTAVVRLRPKPTNSVFNTIGSPTNTSVNGPLLVRKANLSMTGMRDWLLESTRVHEKSLGSDGRFAFHRVYPGAYVLEVNTRGVNLLEREIQVGIAGSTNVSLQVSAFQVTGRVIAPSGGPLPKLNYIRLVHSGPDTQVFYGFPDTEGHFSFVLVPGEYRVFTERLGPSVRSVSDGSRDITNTEFKVEGGRNQQIVVTLEP